MPTREITGIERYRRTCSYHPASMSTETGKPAKYMLLKPMSLCSHWNRLDTLHSFATLELRDCSGTRFSLYTA